MCKGKTQILEQKDTGHLQCLLLWLALFKWTLISKRITKNVFTILNCTREWGMRNGLKIKDWCGNGEYSLAFWGRHKRNFPPRWGVSMFLTFFFYVGSIFFAEAWLRGCSGLHNCYRRCIPFLQPSVSKVCSWKSAYTRTPWGAW